MKMDQAGSEGCQTFHDQLIHLMIYTDYCHHLRYHLLGKNCLATFCFFRLVLQLLYFIFKILTVFIQRRMY